MAQILQEPVLVSSSTVDTAEGLGSRGPVVQGLCRYAAENRLLTPVSSADCKGLSHIVAVESA